MKGPRPDRPPWPRYGAAFVVAYALSLVAWLLIRPAAPAVFVAVDNVAQFLGLLLVLPLCFGVGRTGPGATPRSAQRWVPMLLGLAILSEAAGQIVYTVYEDVLRINPMPFPSWADPVYLSLYPPLLLGVLLLPSRRLPLAARARVLFDGLMIMAAIITASWYFILGPTILQGGPSPLAAAVGAAYPVADLVLMACLLLLANHLGDRRLRPTLALLLGALVAVVITDSIYDLQVLRGAYATGEVLDVGWPLGYMLLGLAARALRLSWARAATDGEGAGWASATGVVEMAPGRPLWRLLLPYAALPPVGLLAVLAARSGSDHRLDIGVYAGAGALVALVVARQVAALRENNRLYASVREANRQLEQRNRETEAHARDLERLNREVRETYDSNRALAEANERLEVLATTDTLTGLANRAHLGERLDRAARDASPARPSALLLLDLDRFKEVNDALGHQVGDALLRTLTVRLRAAAEGADIVARLGGDEFAVLLTGVDPEAAGRVARALIEALTTPVMVEGQALSVGASVGIALAPAHGADGSALLRCADIAMYEAKRVGSGYTLYDPALDGRDIERLALVADLRAAIDGGSLALRYQPKVALATGHVIGVEALVRWPRPDGAPIPPDIFIPIAEQTGLIDDLTRWVLDTALRQCAAWALEGIAVDIAVNLSLRNLRSPGFVDAVAAALARHRLAPRRLCLELTESVMMADAEGTRATLEQLSALGVRLAVDDFGTGYSSLAYLKRLPVDEVKVDKSFVVGLGATSDLRAGPVVRGIVAMGHALGLTVVAEGVETREAWDMLRGFGCDVAQGYYLSRPLPAADLRNWLCSPGHAAGRIGA